MRILVTDGDTRPALAAVRALGIAGHEVIVAGSRRPSLAAASRYCSGFKAYPHPGSDPDGFVTAVLSIVRECQVEMLLPITEVTTLLMTENRGAIPPHCHLPFADAAAISAASDKARVVLLAAELGIPTPHTRVANSIAEALSLADELPFPLVIKPARSRVRTGSTWLSTAVTYAFDQLGLKRSLAQVPEAAFPVLLQERIDGPGRGLFACFDRGRPVAYFAHRRLREKPPSGGVSVLCESSELDPTAVSYGTRLLTRLGWHGVAMVEFKEDRRDRSLRLMEINARFWGSLQLAIDAGVNFPCILANMATGHLPPSPPGYRLGVRSRWLAGDLDSLLMMLTRSRDRLALPLSYPGRLSSIWEFLHFWGSDLRYEVERRDDPGPGLLEWRRRLTGH